MSRDRRAPPTLRSAVLRKCPVRSVVDRDMKPANVTTRLLEILDHLRAVAAELEALQRGTDKKEATDAA